jgi:hypothetical protein
MTILFIPFGPNDVRVILDNCLHASMFRITASSSPLRCLCPSYSFVESSVSHRVRRQSFGRSRARLSRAVKRGVRIRRRRRRRHPSFPRLSAPPIDRRPRARARTHPRTPRARTHTARTRPLASRVTNHHRHLQHLERRLARVVFIPRARRPRATSRTLSMDCNP